MPDEELEFVVGGAIHHRHDRTLHLYNYTIDPSLPWTERFRCINHLLRNYLSADDIGLTWLLRGLALQRQRQSIARIPAFLSEAPWHGRFSALLPNLHPFLRPEAGGWRLETTWRWQWPGGWRSSFALDIVLDLEDRIEEILTAVREG